MFAQTLFLTRRRRLGDESVVAQVELAYGLVVVGLGGFVILLLKFESLQVGKEVLLDDVL